MRKITRKIKLRDIYVGGDAPITIQSMTNTNTKEIKGTIEQINSLEKAGCEIIRSAVNDLEDAKALKEIISHTNIPMVSDIQFDYKLALLAVENGTDGLRINPGNIGGKNKVKEVVKACKEKNVPIRIGVNSGSISKEILDKYKGVNVDSLVMSAMEEVKILEELDFYDICISIKASDVKMMIDSNRKISEMCDYPLHLGVTEAGSLYRGSIKSAIGIGTLLEQGIGDTIRVSLTENPIDEVICASEILKMLGLKKGLKIVSCPTCARTKIDLIGLTKKVEKALEGVEKDITVAIMGCAVNGPGESREADIGIAGGKSEALIFKKGEIIEKVKEEHLLETILRYINEL